MQVSYSEVSMAYVEMVPGRMIEVAKMYLKLDDRDMQARGCVAASLRDKGRASRQPDDAVTQLSVYRPLLQVAMSPFTDLFKLFSDWGGFLSILMAFGLPAVL